MTQNPPPPRRRTGARVPGAVLAFSLAVLLLASGACLDGFFFDPAPIPARVVLVASVDAPPAPVGAAGVEGPQASPEAAFDKADGADVVVRAGERELFRRRLPLEPAGPDRKVSFSVDLPAGGALQAAVELTLVRGSDALFTGSGSAQLVPGQAVEVPVQLSGVVARVEAGGPYQIRTLGGTLKVAATGLFATGDPAGLAVTYRGLDPTITVAPDGTVTAVANGDGRVEASLSGRADTALVKVADPCFEPFPVLALGGAVSSALAAEDCADKATFSYFDWYRFTLAAPALVRATVSASSFEPLVGVSATDGKVLAVASNAGQPLVISDYFWPAGTYLLRVGSRARSEGPAPEGPYTLKLEALPNPEPNAGCLVGRQATWMLPGHEATGYLTANDCGSGLKYDLYGVRLQAGDTVTATITTAYEHRIQWNHDTGGLRVLASRSAAGGATSFLLTAASEGSSSLYIFPWPIGSAGGEYTLRLERGVASTYDPCTVRDNMFINAGTTYQGTLDPASDCLQGDSYIDRYVGTFPDNSPVRTILTSTDFAPFVVALEEGRQTAGRAREMGEVIAEHIYPGGHHEVGVLSSRGVSAGSGYSGAYSLAARPVAVPQNGCVGAAFVFFGSVASGRITSADCLDEAAPDAATVTRWWDGYAILLLPGESVTVSMTARDAPLDFTRWDARGFVEGAFQVQPGQTATLTATQPVGGGAAFHAFFPISGKHEGTGDYTVSFRGTPTSGASRVAPIGPWPPPLLVPGRQGGGGGGGPVR